VNKYKPKKPETLLLNRYNNLFNEEGSPLVDHTPG
jgi:hypothetical protein